MDRAVMDKCDALDGVKDGEINDPQACHFDPVHDLKLCAAGSDGPDCFTQAQADAIAKIHRGPSNSTGQLFPGWVYGGESIPGMWVQPSGGTAYVIGNPNGSKPYSARHYLLANENLKYLVYDDPNYDLHSFNFETDTPAVEESASQIDADNPDITAFEKAGHKLIISVGWSDWAVNAQEVQDYYRRVIAKSGGLDKTRDFARLFMLPNVGHCFASDPSLKAPNVVDYLSAMENWVEKGKAPDQVIASHVASQGGKSVTAPMNVLPPGDVDRTRPICAWPQKAAYKGSGSVDEAANFTCK
jgi:feruloyl esterase